MIVRCFRRRQLAAYTTMDVIGVLSAMGVLAAVLVPALCQTISDARLVSELVSIKNLGDGVQSYYQRYGRFAGVGGTNVSYTNSAYEYWDKRVLLRDGFLERTIPTKLAKKAYLRLTPVTANGGADPLQSQRRGSIGNKLCNNGVYDLTQQYARWESEDEQHYARWTAPMGHPRVRWSPWRGVGYAWTLEEDTLRQANLVEAGEPLAWCAGLLRETSFRGVGGGFFGLWPGGLLKDGFGIGGSPFQCCYPIDDQPAPPPGIGAGAGSGGPSFSRRPRYHNDATDGHPSGVVVELIMEGVAIEDAYRLSVALDGRRQSNWAFWDTQGRVKYDFLRSYTGIVYVYMAHGKN